MVHARQDEDRNKAARRLKGFRLHLLAYFAVSAALVAINLATHAATPWFVWPIVGWGGVLAIHAAYVMGLFGGGRG